MVSSFLTFLFQATGLALSCAPPNSQISDQIIQSRLDKNKFIFKGILRLRPNLENNILCSEDDKKSLSYLLREILGFLPYIDNHYVQKEACAKNNSTRSFYAELNGHLLSSMEFDQPINRVVKINEICFDDWGCGLVPLDQNIIGFLNYDNGIFNISYGVCDAWILEANKVNIKEIIGCANSRECRSMDLE